MPDIYITRSPGGARARFRAFQVLIDGQKVGKLRRGDHKGFKVSTGKHTVRVKVDWAGSPEWGVTLDEHQRAEFICGPAGGLTSALGQMAADDDRYLIFDLPRRTSRPFPTINVQLRAPET
jgi:hypothetical protein